jgi:hypothetical protein
MAGVAVDHLLCDLLPKDIVVTVGALVAEARHHELEASILFLCPAEGDALLLALLA